MIDAVTKRALERTLRTNGFGSGTAKKIVSLVSKTIEEEKDEEPAKSRNSYTKERT